MIAQNLLLAGLVLLQVFLTHLTCAREKTTATDGPWWTLPWDYYWEPGDLPKGLFPTVSNLATDAIITVNATCGETGQEIYCKLVEHVYLTDFDQRVASPRQQHCGVCDASSLDPDKRHPIVNAIDGTNSWWQSPTLQNGKHFEWVTITLDLKQTYQIAYIIIKAGVSPRPGNWILERSLDGIDYKPWQYHAISDAECWEVYGIRPTVGVPHYHADDEVICTSYYSKLNPLENGEIHISLVNGRPGVDGPSNALREFTTARFVRLRLQKIRTLNADLMSLQTDDPQKIDKSVTRRYFYSIKDISIGGQCVCFGHAEECPMDSTTGEFHCVCKHNTCGDRCDHCCPFYNQEPWRAGTNADGAACEKCECFDHANECIYDGDVAVRNGSLNTKGHYTGGGLCINCKHHTSGVNCQLCEDGYYRPSGVSRRDQNACVKCDCSGPGTTGNCVKDDSHVNEGLYPGDCICEEGYMGKKCEKCAGGYKGFPQCTPCPCLFAGTISGTTCEGECVCKLNVEGSRCDRCKPGHYNLVEKNPEGCSPCFCSGVTYNCEESDWGIKTIIDTQGWSISDIKGTESFNAFERNGKFFVGSDEVQNFDTYYWKAPPAYLGKKLYSYGSDLIFTVSYVVPRGDTSGSYTGGPDVILKGNGIRIGSGWEVHKEEENVTLAIPLYENKWYKLTEDGKRDTKPVNRETFSMVLNKLEQLMIRAKYHTEQMEGILHETKLEIASQEVDSIRKMTSVEKCKCPPGFAGLSCETCASGFRRVDNVLLKGTCEKCNCHNHAESCDPVTGQCLACIHNTTGRKCGRCKKGFYGNAKVGLPDDCKPCACPFENAKTNLSPCETVVDPQGSTDYVCTACPKGYEGKKCERCVDGFFGNPLSPGSVCQPCDCNGNVKREPGFCDHFTGQCMKCLYNTRGWNCEECLEGHYGDALKHSCKACECHPFGSEIPLCDPKNGQCRCKVNFIGRQCDSCVEGFGNMKEGCTPCHCNKIGSKSDQCDFITGHCYCKPGVFGVHCDRCLDGYYGFSISGCKWCGCDSNGSENPQCEEIEGNCRCKQHVTGRTCDKCQPGYWNLVSGKGCEKCNCHSTGSTSSDCNITTGQCSCKPGIGGKKCESCLSGFYGLTSSGCTKCDSCFLPGHVCDPQNGRCVCPPNTVGDKCQFCDSDAWGYNPIYGCKLCNCSVEGSIVQTPACDRATGKCTCLKEYEGRRCDHCRHSYYNFPKCQPCNCNADGTVSSECTPDGLCQCDETGQCPCRDNAFGKKCDQCKDGTFGLDRENRKGCLDCFCFGRTKKCKQAKAAWSEIKMSSREAILTLGDTHLSKLQKFNLIPNKVGDITVGVKKNQEKPLYWSLPDKFLGDKVLAYNGELVFEIESRSLRRFPAAMLDEHPLVVLQGNVRLTLKHTPLLLNLSGQHTARLHEDEWKQLDNPDLPVTRTMMMVVLQKLQAVLIRATEGPDVKLAKLPQWNIMRLNKVSMRVAAPLSSRPATPYIAVGVEDCRCPPRYTGYSCQDPADGFYRKRKPNFLDSKDILDLVGWAEPCDCNNKTPYCDKETAVCINCTGNTIGARCELCAPGYYGDPTKGLCYPCACPLSTNSFSDTCRADGNNYVCTNCQKGYTGRLCGRCDDGYYGNPAVQGGTCKPCNCNSYGSQSRICNKSTGQCLCVPGITGRDCTICQPRYILTEVGCKSCDDNCTGILLDDVQFLINMVDETNVSNVILPPWGKLLSLDNTTRYLQNQVEEYQKAVNHGQKLLGNFSYYFDLETWADNLHLRAKGALNEALPVANDANKTLEMSKELLVEIETLWNDILTTVQELKDYSSGPSSHGVSLDDMLRMAENILQELRARDFQPVSDNAKGELRRAQNLLDRVKGLTMDLYEVDGVKERLDNLKELLNEMMEIIKEKVLKPTERAKFAVQAGRLAQKRIKDGLEESTKISDSVNKTLAEAAELVNLAKRATIDATVKFNELKRLQGELVHATDEVEKKRSILSRLNPEYMEKFVIPAQKHADNLWKQAQQLQDRFSATKKVSDLPLKAAKAYKEIVDALKAAEEAAKEAASSAERAYGVAYPGTEDALIKQAERARARSEELLQEAVKLRDENVPELQHLLKEKNDVLNKIEENNGNSKQNLDVINNELNRLPRGVGDELQKVEGQLSQTLHQAESTHQRIDNIQKKIDEELSPRFEALKAGSVAGLGSISDTINKARNDTVDLRRQAEEAERLAKTIESRHRDTQLKLKELKNKIKFARQMASSLKVSLTTDKSGNCVRSYRPQIQPSTTNSIILNYALNRKDDRDSLLFYLASTVSDDFMAIEMVNRKIHFLWNAGGGTQVLKHGRTLQVNDEQLSKEDYWYIIEINRIGNLATLTVKSASKKAEPDHSKVQGHSSLEFTKMNLNSSSHFFIGGIPSSIKVPGEVKTRSFTGCLYEVRLDGSRVGLWNFVTNYGCSGCKEGVTGQVDASKYMFKGGGYAIHRQIKNYPYYEHTITLKFKTFDENALLFFTSNPEKGQFVSLELRSGKIVYQASVGPTTSRLIVSTTKSFNNGYLTKTTIQRRGNKVYLLANSSIIEGKADDWKKNDRIELTMNTKVYYGGVPPNFSASNWPDVVFQGFHGCMSGLQIGSTVVNLLNAEAYNLLPGCEDEAIKIVRFTGMGYIEMKGQPLERESNFSFTFLTKQENALLLLSTFEGSGETEVENNYYSVAVVNGKLETRLNAGKGEKLLESSKPVNDGKYHTVTLLKDRRYVKLRIDDETVGSDEGVRLRGSRIDAPVNGGLFFGGVRNNMTVSQMTATVKNLTGIIKDVIFNNRLFLFNNPIRFVGVGIDHSEEENVSKPIRDFPLLSQATKQCADMGDYSIEKHAAKFGNALESYTLLRVKRNTFRKKFKLLFDFRTYYRNGLFLYVHNGRKKNYHFSVMLREGAVVVDVFDKKNRKLTSHGDLDDGQWHKVVINKSKRNLYLTIDNEETQSVKVRRKLRVRSLTYIGGVSRQMSLGERLVKDSLKGCIRNLHINNKYLDLAAGRPAQAIGQCLAQIEPGAYFGGDAYAVYDDNFNIGDSLYVYLEFKTTQLNGVLLSLSDGTGAVSFSIELHNGKVIVSVTVGRRAEKIQVIKSSMSKYDLCDSKWHQVTVDYNENVVTLKVDMEDLVSGFGKSSSVLNHSRHPLYIGGLPESAPKGSLQIRDNFKGCLRKLSINSRRLDWIHMVSLQNVLPDSCPSF